jgi:uncharacterized protein
MLESIGLISKSMNRGYFSSIKRIILLYVIYLLIVLSEDVVDEKFFSSARTGDIDTLLSYLKQGTHVSSRDGKGNTPLIIASGRGRVDVIRVLLEYGAQVDEETAFGLFESKSAIAWASSQGRVDVVSLLLQAGANPHFPSAKGVFLGKTPMMWSASQGRTDVVRVLLAAGVDVNYASPIGNFKGKTSLMWASSQGRLDTVAVLLEAGADVNAVDADGVSALSWASGSEASDNEGYKKGLMEKANKGHFEVVKKLLRYGAKPDLRDKDGITAIMYASFHGHTRAVQTLLNHGADASVMNKAGKTALQLALNAGFADTAQVIINGPTIIDAPIHELMETSTCGWILSVLRAPFGTGVYPTDVTKARSKYSIEESCDYLSGIGLDTYLGDLLYLTRETSVEEVIEVLSFQPFAAKIRARDQLRYMLTKFEAWLQKEEHFNVFCISNGNYLTRNCTNSSYL